MNGKVNSSVWLLLSSGLLLVLVFVFMQRVNDLAQDVEEGLATIRSLEAQPSDAVSAAELRVLLEEIKEREERALGYLGVFESIGLAITVLGILGTALGAALGISVRGAQEAFSEAKNELENLDKKAQNTNLAQFYVSLAATQRDLGDLNGAQQTYEHARELAPQNPVPYYHIGYILTQLDRFDEAEAILHEALKLDKDFAHAQAALGFVYRRKGDKNEAEREKYYKLAEKYLLAALNNLPRLVDDDGESWHGALGGLFRRQHKLDFAAHHYRIATTITPQSSYPLLNLTMIEWEQKRFDNLIPQLERIAELVKRKVSKDKDTYWDRADLMNVQLALGENMEAFKTLEIFLQVLPNDAKDILPRVIASTEFIRDAAGFKGDKRDKASIEKVLEELNTVAKE